MATTLEFLSVSAALVSAVGGAFAAWAAFRSARSAQAAQDSAERSERRASVRELVSIANAVLIDAQRVASLANEVRQTNHSLAIMSGMSASSRLNLLTAELDKKLAHVTEQAEHAKLYASIPNSLEHAPSEEIDRVHLRLSASSKAIQSAIQDLVREHAIAESQCAERREIMDRAKFAR